MSKADYVIYPAIFDNTDNDGYYTVTFPDIPDTITQGKDLKEALKRAPDAIAVALPDYTEYPTPSKLEDIQKAHPGLLVQYIGVDMKAYLERINDYAVRKSISIPHSLAEAAKEKNLSLSAITTQALREHLGIYEVKDRH